MNGKTARYVWVLRVSFLCLAMLIFALYTIKIYVHDVSADNNNKKHEHYNVRRLFQDGAWSKEVLFPKNTLFR